MNIQAWTEAQYREADSDALEARRAEVLAAAEDPESDAGEVERESRACAGEISRRNRVAELRASSVAAVAGGSGTVVERCGAQAARAQGDDEDPTDSAEYRRAFMEYVRGGKRSDVLKRADANTLTSDVGAVIPTVLVNRIVEKLETHGMILPLVTKTSYPAGMEIPVASLKPVATWVSEGAGSDRQKYQASQKVTFTHHKLRCEVSISMEVGTMALSAFESKVVETVSRAMTVAIESAVIDGSGSGQPKGILKETPADGQALKVAGPLTYAALCEAEAAIPQPYEAGAKWFMSKKTFYSFVGMVDSQGQPVARVDHGLSGRPERFLLGREVVTTGDYLPSFQESPEADTVFAFIYDFRDYTLNTNYSMGISRKQDWDTEDLLTKAVMACDGKAVDTGSLVTLTATKAAAAAKAAKA